MSPVRLVQERPEHRIAVDLVHRGDRPQAVAILDGVVGRLLPQTALLRQPPGLLLGAPPFFLDPLLLGGGDGHRLTGLAAGVIGEIAGTVIAARILQLPLRPVEVGAGRIVIGGGVLRRLRFHRLGHRPFGTSDRGLRLVLRDLPRFRRPRAEVLHLWHQRHRFLARLAVLLVGHQAVHAVDARLQVPHVIGHVDAGAAVAGISPQAVQIGHLLRRLLGASYGQHQTTDSEQSAQRHSSDRFHLSLPDDEFVRRFYPFRPAIPRALTFDLDRYRARSGCVCQDGPQWRNWRRRPSAAVERHHRRLDAAAG
jgi:hypothetical protein